MDLSFISEQQLEKSIAQEFRDKVAINSLLTGILQKESSCGDAAIDNKRPWCSECELVLPLIIRSVVRQLNTGGRIIS